jgi:hypothetical protein
VRQRAVAAHGLEERVVQREVEHLVEVVGPRARRHRPAVPVEHLAQEAERALDPAPQLVAERRREPGRQVAHRVDPQPVGARGVDEPARAVPEPRGHLGALLGEVRQPVDVVGDDLLLVVPVPDVALAVEPARVLGHRGRVVADVVPHDVDPQSLAVGVQVLPERTEVRLGAQPRLHGGGIHHPIAVECAVTVHGLVASVRHRRDPQRPHPERPQVRQARPQPGEIAPVPPLRVGAIHRPRRVRRSVCEPVDEHEPQGVGPGLRGGATREEGPPHAPSVSPGARRPNDPRAASVRRPGGMMTPPVDVRAAALIAALRPSTARKVLRALVRQGEDAALLRLRGALGDRDLGDLSDPAWRELVFDALEHLVSPDLDGTDESLSESAVTRIADRAA